MVGELGIGFLVEAIVADEPGLGDRDECEPTVGYEYDGYRPGVHVGLPSVRPTFMISLAGPIVTASAPDSTQRVPPLQAFVCGVTTHAAEIADPGHGRGVAIEASPLACAALFGVPGSDLANRVVDLHDLLPGSASRLVEQLGSVTT